MKIYIFLLLAFSFSCTLPSIEGRWTEGGTKPIHEFKVDSLQKYLNYRPVGEQVWKGHTYQTELNSGLTIVSIFDSTGAFLAKWPYILSQDTLKIVEGDTLILKRL